MTDLTQAAFCKVLIAISIAFGIARTWDIIISNILYVYVTVMVVFRLHLASTAKCNLV